MKTYVDIDPKDTKAISIIKNHIYESVKRDDYAVFIVWKCKILQNWKYMIATSLPDGKYYELTYNGDKKEWYLDTYIHTDNKVIKDA